MDPLVFVVWDHVALFAEAEGALGSGLGSGEEGTGTWGI